MSHGMLVSAVWMWLTTESTRKPGSDWSAAMADIYALHNKGLARLVGGEVRR